MEEHREAYPIGVMSRVLQISKSGYYAQLEEKADKREQRRNGLLIKMEQIHKEKHGTYGSPRMHRELKAGGEKIGENTVSRWMKDAGIRAKRRRGYVPRTTEGKHGHRIVENLLKREFQAERKNQKWVGDITYIGTGEGWLYLAVVLDLYSRKIVGWGMGKDLKAELAKTALTMALMQRRPGPGLLYHSDRGVQYACREYEELATMHGIERSMSGAGNCYDNAAMESFFSSLKTEWVNDKKYATREEARASIFEYIEVFYNRQRRHSTNGYLSPEDYENRTIPTVH